MQMFLIRISHRINIEIYEIDTFTLVSEILRVTLHASNWIICNEAYIELTQIDSRWIRQTRGFSLTGKGEGGGEGGSRTTSVITDDTQDDDASSSFHIPVAVASRITILFPVIGINASRRLCFVILLIFRM